MILAAQALAYGLEVDNYYTAPYYAEVMIPEKLAGCMLRGHAGQVCRFLLLFESGQIDVAELADLAEVLQVHHLDMHRQNPLVAICFPDWQFEPEEHA